MHLYQDATQGPHVDGQVIGHSQQHLWGTVEATLDILVYLQRERTNNQSCHLPLNSELHLTFRSNIYHTCLRDILAYIQFIADKEN